LDAGGVTQICPDWPGASLDVAAPSRWSNMLYLLGSKRVNFLGFIRIPIWWKTESQWKVRNRKFFTSLDFDNKYDNSDEKRTTEISNIQTLLKWKINQPRCHAQQLRHADHWLDENLMLIRSEDVIDGRTWIELIAIQIGWPNLRAQSSH